MKLKVKLAKLSICECGFGLLHDDIKLGTEFTVYAESVENRGYTVLCGGCGNFTHKKGGRILADCITNPKAAPSYLPTEIFDFNPLNYEKNEKKTPNSE